MSQLVELADDAPVETQTALEYYDTDFMEVTRAALGVLSTKRQLLFAPNAQWFDALKESISYSFPPTVSGELMETAKWDVIDAFVPSETVDSEEARLEATVEVITSFINAFAREHHHNVPTPDPSPTVDTTLDRWLE